jgi:histidine triad (HIT) family protein
MADCLFCKIASGGIPAKIVHQDDRIVAFEDINPQAPTHTLLIPRKHVPTLSDASPEDRELLGELMLAAARIAKDKGLDGTGYRVVANCREGAGQSVFHIHYHLLGGRPLTWPPG